METIKNYSSEIIGVVSFVIGLVVPVVVAKGKLVLGFIKSKIGDANYNECKQFLIQLAGLHPEDFAEEKITDLLDVIDNRFGDHLNKTQIREIVDFVAKTIEADVSKVNVDAAKITNGTIDTGAITANQTSASTIATNPVK